MNAAVFTQSYQEPPFCEREILRYAGCRKQEPHTEALLADCLQEVSGIFSYRICFCELPVSVNGSLCDFALFSLRSEALAKNLSGSDKAIVFAATVGVGIDRLIAKYSRLSPARALMLQAIGAERFEALCDAFCGEMNARYPSGLKPRFSPGYGDLPLSAQTDLFSLLDPPKRIGLSLNGSLLMSPSKSVTAVMGISNPRSSLSNPGSAGAC